MKLVAIVTLGLTLLGAPVRAAAPMQDARSIIVIDELDRPEYTALTILMFPAEGSPTISVRPCRSCTTYRDTLDPAHFSIDENGTMMVDTALDVISPAFVVRMRIVRLGPAGYAATRRLGGTSTVTMISAQGVWNAATVPGAILGSNSVTRSIDGLTASEAHWVLT